MTDQSNSNPENPDLQRFKRLVDPAIPGVPEAEDLGPTPQAMPQHSEQPASSPGEDWSPVPTGGWFAETGESALQPGGVEQPGTGTPTPAPRPLAGPDGKPLLPPPPLGDTPQRPPPALGTQGLPLPRRVDEIDAHATRVAPSAYTPPRPRPAPARPPAARLPVSPPPRQPVRTGTGLTLRQGMGCLLRMGLLGLLGLVMLLILVGSFMLYEYYTIAASLPSVEDLRQRASTFETARIYDRNGNLLYEILDPNAGRRTYVSLDEISPYLVAATIATEDKSYYSHPGFDWMAIVRAFWQNQQEGSTVSGASTITQQLARILLMTPEERYEQSYMRKVREALLAAEVTRRYSKDEILELYLNEIFYGYRAYGIQAAAETYFGTDAKSLTMSQASFLAGLPQAPAVYDVFNNRDATRLRHQAVLTLMYEASLEQRCIYVSNNPERICVDSDTAVAAYVELDTYGFDLPIVEMKYPHWVTYVKSLLETQFDAQTIYRSGFSIYTTIDPELQDAAERIVREQVARLAENEAHNGALIAIRPSTGEILAMVGSADFYAEDIDGQVNMAISPTRQPGSAIKPLTYLAAFERGWTASTLLWDVPTEFSPSGQADDPRPPYVPVNYDGQFHGPVTVRTALANSFNIPAVKTLQFVGIYDSSEVPGEEGLIAMAHRLGITSLNGMEYGMSLTLGGGEVSLLELTGAYAVMANGGRRVAPVAITEIKDHAGNVIYQYEPPVGEQVLRPEHAYIVSSILSDIQARTPTFSTSSVLSLPFQAAVKTGTTNDFRDNWTVGYTPDVAVGVWVGNADYTPMRNTTGLSGAAPIWAEFMQLAEQSLAGGSPTPFVRPAGIVDRVICATSGTEPSQWCRDQRSEIFAADQLPLPSSQDLWTRVSFDTWTGYRASAACADFTDEEFALNVVDPWAIEWIRNNSQGRAWAEQLGFDEPFLFAPPRECRAEDPRPTLNFTSLSEGQTLSVSPVDIHVVAFASADFLNFELDYGLGENPVEWHRLAERSQPITQSELLFQWNLGEIPPGVVTLRLTMHSIRNTQAERLLHINLQVPTQTATATATPTATGTPVPTLAPTLTPTVTPTYDVLPVVTDTPTITPTAPTPVLDEPTPTPQP